MANGSDAITGVTWNGISYNYDLDLGKPVRLSNGTSDEDVVVGKDGMFSVGLPFSSAAMITLDCK
jgi:hypothetical protein